MGSKRSKETPVPCDRARAVQLLREGKPPQEVASIMGCTVRQVKRAGQRFCADHAVSPLMAFGRRL